MKLQVKLALGDDAQCYVWVGAFELFVWLHARKTLEDKTVRCMSCDAMACGVFTSFLLSTHWVSGRPIGMVNVLHVDGSIVEVLLAFVALMAMHNTWDSWSIRCH